MILILFFIIIPIITIIIAVMADKKKARFFFGMRPDESILASVDSALYYTEDKLVATTGILYITNLRLVFFRYKYKFLGFIPFLGSVIEALFIDKNVVFEIPVNNVYTYQFKKTKYVNQNETVLDCFCEATLITKGTVSYKLNIPMSFLEYDKEKPELLTHLDLLLSGR